MRYGYPVSRGDRQWYEGRWRYVNERSSADEPRLCHVMEEAAERACRLYHHGDVVPQNSWTGFPWLTVVLGSGAVAIADEPGLNSAAISAKVRSIISSRIDGTDGPPTIRLSTPTFEPNFPTIAEEFTRSLAQDRLQEEYAAPQPNLKPVDPKAVDLVIEPVAADLALLTALLTSWFNRVRSAFYAPLSRWDDDRAVHDVNANLPSLEYLDLDVLEPAIIVLNHVRSQLKQGETTAHIKVANAVTDLLALMSTSLQPGIGMPRTLRIEHLRLLTEVCWHFLLLETSMYPGWTDLLLGLMLQEKRGSDKGFRRARPLFKNLRSLPEYVTSLMTRPTERSWDLSEPVDGDENLPGPRDSMYRSIGDVLWTQADLVARRVADAPPAVAFVTSFDLEVEMGLWMTAPENGTGSDTDPSMFNVVVPVHVLRDASISEAEPCWLLGQIRPDHDLTWKQQLKSLRNPSNWRVLHSKTPLATLRRHPTVVRLSGCPLFSLPDLEDSEVAASMVDQLEGVGISFDSNNGVIVPAVTVDEYLALRQAEAEFFWSSSHIPSEAPFGRGLPTELTMDGDANPRFWMALGVPIGDPAVRHRLVSQITLRRMREAVAGFDPGAVQSGNQLGAPPAGEMLRPPESGTPDGTATASVRRDVDGVVVNRRVNDDEASLLYWLGLDVVRDDCQSFVKDLNHYVDHLLDPGPARRTPPSGACRVAARPGSPR